MSHFYTMVLIPEEKVERLEDEVARLLAPYDEQGEWGADGTRWDWYVLGGRWMGGLDPEYDPAKDPRNYSTCRWCEGTGDRKDLVPTLMENGGLSGKTMTRDRAEAWKEKCGGCNACHGTGKSRNYQNAPHPEGTVRMVREVLADMKDDASFADRAMPHAIVTPDGAWHEEGRCGMFAVVSDKKAPAAWKAKALALMEQHPEAVAVVVDCHV